MVEIDGRAALLGADARARFDGIVDGLMERQRLEVPEYWVTDDRAFDDAVLRSTRDNVELMVTMLQRPVALPHALPAGARLEAGVAAQYGARLDALLRTYRLGQQALVEHFIDAIERRAVPDAAQAVGQLRAATRAVHAYTEAVMPLVAREYDDERARLEAWPELRRLRLVQAALAGDESAELDYPFAGAHVALVASGDAAAVAAAVSAAADALGVASLVVETGDGRTWAWAATDRLAELRAHLKAAGVSGPGGIGGPAGFRDAHGQALLADRIARSRRDGLVDLRGAALEALALGDQRTARAVARSELGPLARAGVGNERLRATLEAWFASRESPTAAAATLGVAPRTVTYRLRRAEGLLGHPIAERRAELEAALRLERLFASEPQPPTAFDR
jgi:hypothetical protein